MSVLTKSASPCGSVLSYLRYWCKPITHVALCNKAAKRLGSGATHVALCNDIHSYLIHWYKVLAAKRNLDAKMPRGEDAKSVTEAAKLITKSSPSPQRGEGRVRGSKVGRWCKITELNATIAVGWAYLPNNKI